MSASLTNDIPSTVSAVLDRLDEVGTASHSAGQHFFHDRHVGPFGVFRSRAPLLSDPEARALDPLPQPSPPQLASGFVCPITSSPNQGPSNRSSWTPGGATEFHESLNEFLTSSLDTMQWGDLFQWDFDYSLVTEADTRTSELNTGCTTTLEVTDSEAMTAIETNQDGCLWPEIDLSSEAPLLLKHFNEEVITQMGSLPINEKSAWRTLNFSSAVMTLSQLTILGFDRSTIKRANLANFLAVIAMSALHLSLNPNVQRDTSDACNQPHYWKSLSERTYEAAKNFLRCSLFTECTLQNKAKYKDQLMAVGAVLAIAVSLPSTFSLLELTTM